MTKPDNQPWTVITQRCQELLDLQNAITGPAETGLTDALDEFSGMLDVVHAVRQMLRRFLVWSVRAQVLLDPRTVPARTIVDTTTECLSTARALLEHCEGLVSHGSPKGAARRLVKGYQAVATAAEGEEDRLWHHVDQLTAHERARVLAVLRQVVLAAGDLVGAIRTPGLPRQAVLRAHVAGVRSALHDCARGLADLVADIDATALVVCAVCGTPQTPELPWITRRRPGAAVADVEVCGLEHLEQWAASHPELAQRPAATVTLVDLA